MEFNLSLVGVTCSVLIKDSVTGRRLDSGKPYRAILKCRREVTGDLFVILSGRSFENSMYNIKVLKGVYTEQVDEGILVFGFRKPKQDIMLITDVPGQAKSFVKNLFNEITLANIKVKLDLRYDPDINGYLGLKRFDRNTLDLGNLNVLILENCVLPSLVERIGDLAVSYLSVSGSTLGGNERERDVFWDWMCLDTVGETLKILEMNKVGLKSIPFEISYLKNLHTLSLAENQLTDIPYFIGELKSLDSLFINNNSIMYLPLCLHDKAFKDFNFSNNIFEEYDESIPRKKKGQIPLQEKIRLLRRKGKPPLHSLFHLSLFTMVDNGIKIRRDSLPPGLYQKLKDLGGKLARCQYCMKLLLPEHSFRSFEKESINSRNLMRNDILTWNSFECIYKCSRLSDIEFRLK